MKCLHNCLLHNQNKWRYYAKHMAKTVTICVLLQSQYSIGTPLNVYNENHCNQTGVWVANLKLSCKDIRGHVAI